MQREEDKGKALSSEEEEDGGSRKRKQQEGNAKRKQELVELRDENKRLRVERNEFLKKIQELEQKVNSKFQENQNSELLSQNDILRVEIAAHQKLVAKFASLYSQVPTRLTAEHVIYKEGGDNAISYVLGLMSLSQTDWIQMRTPGKLLNNISLKKFSVCYRFKRDLFGEKTKTRLNLRVDFILPRSKAEQAAEFFWREYSTEDVHRKMFEANDVQMTPIQNDAMPDRNTKVVHYRRVPKDSSEIENLVFICRRELRELAKSTLATPQRPSVTHKAKEPNEFGKVDAHIVATTSTSLYSSHLPMDANSGSDQDRIHSLVVKGTVVWQEGEDSRLVVLYSIPEDHKVVDKVKFTDIVDHKGTMTKSLSKVIQAVFGRFKNMFDPMVAQAQAQTKEMDA